MKKLILVVTLVTSAFLLTACGSKEEAAAGIDPKVYTDSLFAVMKADRTNYTKYIIKRLGPAGSGVIKPDEQWKDHDNGALLPAQFFRAGSEAVAEMTDDFSYQLKSLWPINAQNKPKSEIEKTGLQYVADNPGENFYGTEELGGTKYFTAVYADVAVATPCVTCHNEHKDSPRTDFKMGEVMGGVVVRVPM